MKIEELLEESSLSYVSYVTYLMGCNKSNIASKYQLTRPSRCIFTLICSCLLLKTCYYTTK